MEGQSAHNTCINESWGYFYEYRKINMVEEELTRRIVMRKMMKKKRLLVTVWEPGNLIRGVA